ncbi:tetratricopeptide repeat protein [Amycolatopsis sp. SID8362]|uniref:tetratricopeptide repeat protein n=1 Tax=Amycolatopsis sp. SID8362 TaxID=2690346 RepID=UPI001370DA42|nr:tetratricopeptide repeat protein [Amycolatopsis sp. SID8362]NBH06908.1 AAA family ATPase [Amycolatopsis sp. SID8362]NED43605.1 AAA family ATPase [Amycolatopsis sp. SID8362]
MVGRDRELAQLDSLRRHRREHPRIAVLTGVGGVGKTALAVHWLTTRRDAFPDGVLYASFASDDESPESPDIALHGFLTALGVPAEDIPAQTGQRAALFRAFTSEHSLALLLDNVVFAGQVRALLPAAPTAFVLVTSRTQLSGLSLDGADIVPVEPLADRDAHTLLDVRAGRGRLDADPAAAADILRACGGLPLRIAVVGARLRTRPERSLAREVRHTPAGESTRKVFEASYDSLSPAAAELYRLCGLLPGEHLALDALAHVLSTPVESLDGLTDELVEANLLSEHDEVVSQHDVVREDARARCVRETPEPQRTTALHSYVRWYADRAVAADELIHPFRPRFAPLPGAATGTFADRDQAIHWWRRDQQVIRVVVREAAARGWDTEVWQLCEASWGYFLYNRDYEPFLALTAVGIAATRRCGLPLVEARLHSQLGYALEQLGRFGEAAAHNAVALEIGERENHGPTRATAVSRLAAAARREGDLERALELYERSAELHTEIALPRGVALARRRRGELFLELNRDEEAAAELTAAATAMAELGDANQHARVVTALARLHERHGRPGEARTRLLEALEVIRPLDSPYYTAEILAALAELEARHDDLEHAREHRAEARRLYAELGDPRAGELADDG